MPHSCLNILGSKPMGMCPRSKHDEPHTAQLLPARGSLTSRHRGATTEPSDQNAGCI